MDRTTEGQSKFAVTAYTAVLAKTFDFAGKLGSQARQAAAERSWEERGLSQAVAGARASIKQQAANKRGGQ